MSAATPIDALSIRFQHDYLLLLTNTKAQSYSEVRFSFLYPCRQAAGVSDFTFMSSGTLSQRQFPIVISTVWELRSSHA